MTEHERKHIAKIWHGLAQMYGREIHTTALGMMLNAVDDLNFHEIEKALNDWARESKLGRHPFPAEVREKLKPTLNVKDVAREDAMRIVQAVSKFGYMRGSDAKTFVGERGWVAVERWGGWGYVCSSLGVTIELNAFVAQTRDMLESHATLQNQGHDLDQPVQVQGGNFTTMIQSSKKGLESTSDILQKLINKGERK